MPACLLLCSLVLHHLLYFLVPLSLPQVPPHAAGTEQTHPGDSHTQSNHLSPTYKLHVCPHRGVCMFRVQIWSSSLRPLSFLSTPRLRRERVHVCAFMLSSLHVFPHAHLHHVAPGRALSRPQESFWELVREDFRECVCKAVRWICVHHDWVWPRGHDRRSEQRVFYKGAADTVQKESN